MREIKFRAWDKESKKWLHRPTFYIHCDGEINTWEVGDEDKYLRSYHPELILMQYTGLKDKNGKEIYEGDIVSICGRNLISTNTYINFQPKIGDKYFCIKLKSGFTLCPARCFHDMAKTCDYELIPNIHGYINNYDFWNGASTASNVIGNIYENPELMESK